MPLQYKIPGYLGNGLLLILGVVILAGESVPTGLFLGLLSLLNLYLVYKLDSFSRSEVQLAHELQMTKMREELALAQKRLRELEGGPSGSTPAPSG
jgi:hypothetical protein